MKRRDFLRTSLVGLSSPLIISKANNLKTNKNNPVILSTWEFGLAANKKAIKVLNSGGNSMDAAEKAARHAEADPNNNSVGLGGLPDEKGKVTLDACVMDSTGNAGSVAFLQNIKHPVVRECLKIFNSYDKVDFLNIDVEGMDLKILRQLIPHKLTPSLISIETHSPDSKKLRDCDEINRYLIGNNYAVFKRVGPTTLFSVNK